MVKSEYALTLIMPSFCDYVLNFFVVYSGGGAMESGRSQTTYGMTSAISLAGPTLLDIRLSKTLEDTLRSFDMFETDEQMALRFDFL